MALDPTKFISVSQLEDISQLVGKQVFSDRYDIIKTYKVDKVKSRNVYLMHLDEKREDTFKMSLADFKKLFKYKK